MKIPKKNCSNAFYASLWLESMSMTSIVTLAVASD